MKKPYFILLFCLIIPCAIQTLWSQAYSNNRDLWVVGFDISTIYDTGGRSDGLLNLEVPFRVAVEKQFRRHFGVEISASHNRFSEGKEINGSLLSSDTHVIALDGMLKGYFSDIFWDLYRTKFRTYITAGVGIGLFNDNNGETLNMGLGGNYYFNDYLFVSARMINKIAITNNLLGNYGQFTIGIGFKPYKFRN